LVFLIPKGHGEIGFQRKARLKHLTIFNLGLYVFIKNKSEDCFKWTELWIEKVFMSPCHRSGLGTSNWFVGNRDFEHV